MMCTGGVEVPWGRGGEAAVSRRFVGTHSLRLALYVHSFPLTFIYIHTPGALA